MSFDFGLWNYIDADKYPFPPKRLIEEWKSLHITTGCSFVTDGTPAEVAPTKALLAAADQEGMNMIVYDKRVFWKNYREKGAQRYAAEVALSLKDFGGFSCAVGYLISDEPSKEELPIVKEALDIFKRLTDKIGFVNFSWCDARHREYGSYEAFADELCAFAENRLAFIANDRYSCMHARDYEAGFKETGIDKFFADMNFFKGVADRTGLEYRTSLLSVGHWMYRTPSEDDIRWQLSVAAAHGAQGIQWFFIDQHRLADDYYTYPVDIYGERTPIFDAIQRQTQIFIDKVAKPLDGYHFRKVWHTGKSYGKTPLLQEGDAEIFVWSDHGQNGILSLFEKSGKKIYLLVNNDQRYPEVFFIRFVNDPARNYHIWLNCGGTHLVRI